MSYPLAVDRRARRRRRVAAVLLLLTVVVVIALAVRYRTERRATSDYLAVAQLVIDEELDIAASLSDLMASIGDLERPSILVRLEDLAIDAEVAVTSLRAADVSRPVAEASGLLTAAVATWADGVAAIGPAFVAVLDGAPDDPLGDQLLREAFDTLAVGDAAYRRFLEVVASIDADVAPGEFPAFAFASGQRAPLFDATTIASRLRLTRRLGEKHDVAVTATMEPEPVTDPSGVPVLPVAPGYDIVAVINNEGNVAEEAIEVALVLSGDASSETIELTELVPFLEPGEAVTVVFKQVVLVPGRFYQLKLTVSITEDAEPDDNVFELPVFTDEAA